MGLLIYGSGNQEVEIDDRTLAHLQVLIIPRLRRHECFALSWSNGRGGGGDTIWISPSIPIRFSIWSAVEPINRGWLELLAGPPGRGEIRIIPEPA